VVEHAVLAVLGVDAVEPDVPDGHVRHAEAVRRLPVEGVLAEVVRGQVEDRDAVRAHDDPVLPLIRTVEDHLAAIDAPDRDVVLLLRDDVAARVRAFSEQNRVARCGAGDRELERRHVLRHAYRRGGAVRTCGRSGGSERQCQPG
jgi:hypothetical protein